jgi:hypothetical protein
LRGPTAAQATLDTALTLWILVAACGFSAPSAAGVPFLLDDRRVQSSSQSMTT